MKDIMILLVTVCFSFVLTSGCDDSSDTSAESVPSGLFLKETYKEIEIAPDKWLKVKSYDYLYEADYKKDQVDPHNMTMMEAAKQIADSAISAAVKPSDSEQSGFHFTWNEIDVKWQGYEIPISLREFEGSLYMIGFNREEPGNSRFVYFRLNDKGNGFVEIDAKDYPKRIATQNLWLKKELRYITYKSTGENDWKRLTNLDKSDPLYLEPIDTLKILRELDVEHPAFFSSGDTYSIWIELEKNVGLQEQQGHNSTYINQKFMIEFKNKYNPIALPTIIKEQEQEKE